MDTYNDIMNGMVMVMLGAVTFAIVVAVLLGSYVVVRMVLVSKPWQK